MSRSFYDMDPTWHIYLSKDAEGRRKMANDAATCEGCAWFVVMIIVAVLVVSGLRSGAF